MAKQKNDSKNDKKNNANNTESLEKNSSTKKTKSTTKNRDTLNISIQKRNYNEINNIINSWYKDDLNVSNEACKAILLRDELESNPYIQTLLSTLDLLRTHLKSKNLYEEDFQSALFKAFKNIISIKIDAHELSNFLENDSYFKNDNTKQGKDSLNIENNTECTKVSNNKSSNLEKSIDKQSNSKTYNDNTTITNAESNTNSKTENIIQDKSNLVASKETSITKEEVKSSKEINSKESNNIINWNFPTEPTFPSQNQNNLEDVLNKKFGVFSYEN